MCGIVGYTGKNDCVDILLSGLEKLAYRGYDSAGIAVWDGSGLSIRKEKGRIAKLKEVVGLNPVSGRTGIGHTRWATHGEPSFANSHPHTDYTENFALVHNGIIENYAELKKMLTEKGIVFASQTDTEVIVQLLGYNYDGDMLLALRRTMQLLEGSFALAILCKNEPDLIYCACRDNPLVLGMGENGGFIASDIPAILEYTQDVYFMAENEVALVRPNEIEFFDALGNKVEHETTHISWDASAASRGSFEHYMLKEIHEQPTVLSQTYKRYVKNGVIIRENMPYDADEARKLGGIKIAACGTAYHAGLVGKAVVERIARLPVSVDIASEFRYNEPIFAENDTVIVISQSGETADTIAAMRLAKRNNVKVTAICNVIGSSITREADKTMYTLAGPEIAVASTKAFITQLMTLYILALDLALLRGVIDEETQRELLLELEQVSGDVSQQVSTKENIQHFASCVFNKDSVFYIGRGLDYALTMEAALKLKEISYIHSEAYAAGELKHGTIALIEPGTLVVAMCTQKAVLEKMASNIQEVKARGAKVLAVTCGCQPVIEAVADEVWQINERRDIFLPISAIIPMQLFAYYMAVLRGCDVDKPRNLAKSVTVE